MHTVLGQEFTRSVSLRINTVYIGILWSMTGLNRTDAWRQ